MHELATPVRSRWITHVRNTALTLLAVTSTACLGADDVGDIDDEAITSELTGGSGDADLYKCGYSACKGTSIRFDSLDLGLRNCAYDARANMLDCEAHAVDSPLIPSELWLASAAQLSCTDGLLFGCTSRADLLSCACASSTGTGTVKYGPVIKVKPQG